MLDAVATARDIDRLTKRCDAESVPRAVASVAPLVDQPVAYSGDTLAVRRHPASVLGKDDPKSGQITPALNRQPHLKSRHSRVYAIRLKWHAAWLFNFVIPCERMRATIVASIFQRPSGCLVEENAYEHNLAGPAIRRANFIKEARVYFGRRAHAWFGHRR